MTDLMLDPDTRDLLVSDGDLSFVLTEQELTRQVVITTLKTNTGEWFRNIDYGTPWIVNENNAISILGKTTKAFFDSQIRLSILSNPQVLEILSYSTNLNSVTGSLSMSSVVRSANGNVSVEQPIN